MASSDNFPFRSEDRTQPTRPRDASATLEQLRTDVMTQVHARIAHDRRAALDDQTTEEYTVQHPSDPHPPDGTTTTVTPTPSIEVSAPKTLWTSGAKIDARYQLLQPLAAGAWGTIWKARQLIIGRFVAIKILKERDEASMQKARSRFEREAKLASRVRHPSAVRVLDYGHVQNQPYLVMEWLEGLSLQRFLQECGPLPPELILDIGVGVAGALHAAHQEDVIHRDLKPSNIMLVETSSGLTPVVVDFGLARTFTPDEATVTHANMIVGTPAFMSPEAIRGRPLTPASDIYSLGVTFLTMLLGENPFRGENGSVTMTNHLIGPSFDAHALEQVGCTPGFARTLMAMIALEPDARPHAQTLEDRFKSLLDQALVDDRSPSFSDSGLFLNEGSYPIAPDSQAAFTASDFFDVGTPNASRAVSALEASVSAHPAHAPPDFDILVSSTPRDVSTFETAAATQAQPPSARPAWQSHALTALAVLFLTLSLVLLFMQRAQNDVMTGAFPPSEAPTTRSFDAPEPDAPLQNVAMTLPPVADAHPPQHADNTAETADAPTVPSPSPTDVEASAQADTPPPSKSATDAARSDTNATRTRRDRATSRKKASSKAEEEQKAPAALVLTLSPPGTVYVDGTSHGLRSSLLLENLSSGSHTVRVEREGSATERRIRLEAGKRHVETF